MFKCQVTGRSSKAGDKLNKIVVETRTREYRHWDRENEEEWFSQGSEIVREINATDEGVRIWDSLSPEERQEFLKGLN
jgi:hypothetical protein